MTILSNLVNAFCGSDFTSENIQHSTTCPPGQQNAASLRIPCITVWCLLLLLGGWQNLDTLSPAKHNIKVKTSGCVVLSCVFQASGS